MELIDLGWHLHVAHRPCEATLVPRVGGANEPKCETSTPLFSAFWLPHEMAWETGHHELLAS